jgi:uncharacterized protein (DUF305 family)
MQDMIGHHAQALTMTALAPAHGQGSVAARREDRHLAARRDRHDEALARRAQAGGARTTTRTPRMPGMLTQEQLAQLAAARGPRSTACSSRLMIQHHEGAVHMVETLFASPGAAQDSDIFRFATDVEADQRDEIDVMSHMLDMLTNRGSQL